MAPAPHTLLDVGLSFWSAKEFGAGFWGQASLFCSASFISQSSKQHMLQQCNHLIQASETCSPDERLVYRLRGSSAALWLCI